MDKKKFKKKTKKKHSNNDNNDFRLFRKLCFKLVSYIITDTVL